MCGIVAAVWSEDGRCVLSVRVLSVCVLTGRVLRAKKTPLRRARRELQTHACGCTGWLCERARPGYDRYEAYLSKSREVEAPWHARGRDNLQPEQAQQRPAGGR